MNSEGDCAVCGARRWKLRFHKQHTDFIKCRECGLTKLSPTPTVEELNEHYTGRAESGNYRPELAAERTRTLRGIADVIQRFDQSGRILDVGCFDGTLLDLAKENGWDPYGIELQGPAATLAAKKHPGRIMHVTVEDAATQIEGEFEAISAIGVIEHLRDPLALVALADRSLVPGGLLVVQTPDAGSLPARLLGRYWPCLAAPEHITYFSRRNLRRLLVSRGFTIESSKSHWKRLRIGYAYDQLDYFGPELKRFVRLAARIVPKRVWQLHAPLYGGEMLVVARKRDN